MSIPAWKQALAVRGLTHCERLVLIAFADHADQGGTSWPSQSRIADMMEMSIMSVKRAVKSLEARGLITRTRRKTASNPRKSDLTRMILPVAAELPSGVTVLPAREHHVTPRGNTMFPKPITEPSKNHWARPAPKFSPSIKIDYPHPGASPYGTDEEKREWMQIMQRRIEAQHG